VRVKQLVAASAASGILALGLAPSASAGSSSVVVQPGTVAPGGQVSVFGTQCKASTGTATSPAFSSPISLSMLSNSTGGVGTVSSSAKPGTWPVTVTCGTQTFTGSVTVSSAVMPSPVPSGGAATGDGSSQSSVASGLGSGIALTAVGAGIGVFVLRRRRAGARD
jgi:hypothetical protein